MSNKLFKSNRLIFRAIGLEFHNLTGRALVHKANS